ncbi:hypothetical protein HID58_076477, partial [Brassica napus]
INGLKPLIMRMDIELPSKKVVEVDLCHMKMKIASFALHLDKEEIRGCWASPNTTPWKESKKAKGGRKAGDKLVYNKDNRERELAGLTTNMRTQEMLEALLITIPLGLFLKGALAMRKIRDVMMIGISNPSSRRTPPRREGRDQPSADYVSHSREPLAPPMHNKPGISPIREERSRSNQSPGTNAITVQRRNSIADRLSDPRGSNSKSEERICAKDRLSVHTQRTSLNERSESNSNSKHIHNVELQEVDENMHLPVINSITRPSSSNVFDSGRLGPSERSPIRTLSEDRIHVSLRLGPLLQTETEESEENQLTLAALAKAAGKRKVGNSQTLRKVGNSPAQGHAIKKRRVTKVHPSPKRKLMLDAIIRHSIIAWVKEQNLNSNLAIQKAQVEL